MASRRDGNMHCVSFVVVYGWLVDGHTVMQCWLVGWLSRLDEANTDPQVASDPAHKKDSSESRIERGRLACNWIRVVAKCIGSMEANY